MSQKSRAPERSFLLCLRRVAYCVHDIEKRSDDNGPGAVGPAHDEGGPSWGHDVSTKEQLHNRMMREEAVDGADFEH